MDDPREGVFQRLGPLLVLRALPPPMFHAADPTDKHLAAVAETLWDRWWPRPGVLSHCITHSPTGRPNDANILECCAEAMGVNFVACSLSQQVIFVTERLSAPRLLSATTPHAPRGCDGREALDLRKVCMELFGRFDPLLVQPRLLAHLRHSLGTRPLEAESELQCARCVFGARPGRIIA